MGGEGMSRFREFLGGLQQRLRGNAADIEAGAAECAASLDTCDAQAELRRADRHDIASGPAANDDDIEALAHPRSLRRTCVLHIKQDALRILDTFLDAHEEGHRLAAVDDAVIVAEREIHHWSDFDLVADDDGALVVLVHPVHGRLRRPEARRRHQSAAAADDYTAEGTAALIIIPE